MRNGNGWISVFLALLVFLLLSACGPSAEDPEKPESAEVPETSKTVKDPEKSEVVKGSEEAETAEAPEEAEPDPFNTPSWVKKGSGAFEVAGKRVFYGVGSAEGIRNYALMRMTADKRARVEIAKAFSFFSNAFADTSGMKQDAKEGDVSLSEVRIIDHWEHPQKNLFFSLARADLGKFVEQALRKKRPETMASAADFEERGRRLHESMKR